MSRKVSQPMKWILTMDEYEPFSEMEWWEEDAKILCRYCGKDISKSESDYCSIDCEKADSIWHRVN